MVGTTSQGALTDDPEKMGISRQWEYRPNIANTKKALWNTMHLQ